jgi:hypothetical protein
VNVPSVPGLFRTGDTRAGQFQEEEGPAKYMLLFAATPTMPHDFAEPFDLAVGGRIA